MAMDYASALAYVHGFDRFGSILGLERIRRLLHRLGDPQKRLRFVHVAGTNGKGSTVAFCARVLSEAGYRTGMYSSPYIVDFRERIQIDGEMIGEDAFAELMSRVRPEVEQLQSAGEIVTEFEVITAAAMLYFAEQRCAIVCLEVGLGGRFDATNVIDTPLVSVITSISLDHVGVLGDTVAQIAREKAGIIKPNGTTVCYPLQDADALSVLFERCASRNNRLILPNAAGIELVRSDLRGSVFRYEDATYTIGLVGVHQVYNAVTALTTLSCLRAQGFLIPPESVQKGLRETAFPARFEIVSEHPYTVIDGAHNPDGAKALANTLRAVANPRTVAVMAMMADKDCAAVLSEILPLCKALFAVPATNPRALAPERLAEMARAHCTDVRVETDLAKALRRARAEAGADGLVVVCGSLYLASDVRKIVKR